MADPLCKCGHARDKHDLCDCSTCACDCAPGGCYGDAPLYKGCSECECDWYSAKSESPAAPGE